MTRKVYRLSPKAGSMNNLNLAEENIQEPGPDEVAVDIKAVGLNFADISAILGLYSATPKGSFIPGLEYSGIVTGTGSEVSNFKTGDRVMGITRFGGYASQITISHHYLTKMSDDWSFQDGAAYLVQALTAYYALVKLAAIEPNQTVLIQSAAGGVGILANRLAKKYNAYTIGTIGRPSKTDILRKEGYDEVIVRSENFRDDLKNALGKRQLNIVLESIGGQVLKESFRQMAIEGRMIVYGAASFMPHGSRPNYFKLLPLYLKRPMIDPIKLTEWNKSVMGFNLIHLYEQRESLKKYLQHLEQLDLGKPYIGHTFPFSELKEGLKLLQSGKTTGKVVITLE